MAWLRSVESRCSTVGCPRRSVSLLWVAQLMGMTPVHHAQEPAAGRPDHTATITMGFTAMNDWQGERAIRCAEGGLAKQLGGIIFKRRIL